LPGARDGDGARPAKAIGKGLFSNAFIAMLLTERFAAGRSMNSLVAGLSRHGAEISVATLAGTCAQAAGLLEPLASAIAARNRESWHLHADETTWRVFAPGDGGGPAKWWLWVFIGPDTACFVMDPSRSGQVLPGTRALRRRPGSSRQTVTAARGGWCSPATSTPFTSPPGRRPTAWSISGAGRTSGGTSCGPATRARSSWSTGPRAGWS
jgi:hypothetical protein